MKPMNESSAPPSRAFRRTALLLALALPLAAACRPAAADTAPGAPGADPAAIDGPAAADTASTASATTTATTATTPLPVPPPPPPPQRPSPSTSRSTTTTATSARPAAAPLAVRPDGLGTASFGEGYDDAVGDLVSVLGAPDDAGTVGAGFGTCGVIHHRDVRWGDLTVSFTDTGSGLHLGGWYWGEDIGRRNAFTDHPAPVGPGTPSLGNPWGLDIGTPVPSAEAARARIGAVHPDARLVTARPIVDPVVSITVGDHIVDVVLHAAGDEGWLVESIWAFTPAEVTCH
jgi:hypothetical protein